MSTGEAGPATTQAAEQNFVVNAWERIKDNSKRIAAVGAVAVAGFGVYELGRSSSDSQGTNTPVAEASAQTGNGDACANYEFSNVTDNSENYNPNAFLPKAALDSPDTVQKYVQSNLFSQKGPVTDPETLAALFATVVEPAQKGTVNDPNYSYTEAFSNKVAAYKATGGLEVAQKDCETAYDVLYQVAGYNHSWAKQGEKVSQFKALRDQGYSIDGAELTKPQVVEQTLSGAEFILRDTTKGKGGEQLQGFASVLVTPDGNIYIKGLSPSQAGKTTENKGKQPKHQRKHNRGQQPAGSGNGQAVGPGNNPENLPNGPLTGPKGRGPSHAGGPPEAGHGPGRTPGPGGGGGGGHPGGGPPGGEAPPTTTTPPPTTTTPPPETTPPKGGEPPCEPNPPYVIC